MLRLQTLALQLAARLAVLVLGLVLSLPRLRERKRTLAPPRLRERVRQLRNLLMWSIRNAIEC